MKLDEYKIGYVPYSYDFQHPADRRRFCFYAANRNIQYQIATAHECYDLLILSGAADPDVWCFNESEKIIYDVVDARLAHELKLRTRIAGLVRFIFRKSRFKNYQEGVKALCRNSDAVICGSETQKLSLERYNKNVSVVLDNVGDAAHTTKLKYDSDVPFNIAWEGFRENIQYFSEIKPAIKSINKEHRLAFHLITNIGKSYEALYIHARHCIGIDQIFLYPWNQSTVSFIITACDMAVIPVPLNYPFAVAKPANKLFYFWQIRVPVIASATPAYSKVASAAKIDMICRSTDDWKYKIKRYMLSSTLRQQDGQKGYEYAESVFKPETILEQWDHVLISLIG